MSLTAHQRKRRLGRLTSSLAAAALGVHEYMTPIQAWLAIKGENSDVDVKATQRGNRLEKIILSYTAEKHGFAWRKPAFITHPDLPKFFGDSADAIYVDKETRQERALGEGKSAAMGAAKRYGEEDTDDVPMATLIQSHWHLIHRPSIPVCYVPVMVGGFRFEFREYVVKQDPEFSGLLIEDCSRWYRDYVIADKAPPAKAKDEDWITERYAKAANGLFLPDSPELADWVRQKCEASVFKKHWEDREKLAKNLIRQYLGDAEAVHAQWGKVTWTNNAPSVAVNYSMMFADLCQRLNVPQDVVLELERAHTYEKPGSRVLRVTNKSATADAERRLAESEEQATEAEETQEQEAS